MTSFFAFLVVLGCGAGILETGTTEAASPTHKTFQVMRFGAMGNGVADDAPAIQRALTAVQAAGGGELDFPCGDFALLSVAGAAPGERSLLYLDNAQDVRLKGKGSCTHLFTALPQKSVLEFENSQNIEVSSMKITALNAPYVETNGMDGGSAVRFTDVSYGKVDHLEIDGASAGAIYFTKSTNHSSVSNNVVHDTYGSGIWEDSCGSASAQNCLPSSPPSNNVYEGNTLTNTTLDGVSALSLDDGGGTVNAVVRNNTIAWTRPTVDGNFQVHCIQVNDAVEVSVVNNSCSGTPWDAIVVTSGPGGKAGEVTIQGNTITSSGTSPIGGSGIVVYDGPHSFGISGVELLYNNITTAGDDGIRFSAGAKPGSIHDSAALHNTIAMTDQRQPGSRFGIDVEHSAAITISSNNITCNGSCIAAGVNIYSSTNSTPTASANTVVDIIGSPLFVH